MPGRTSAGVGKHRIPPSTRGMRDSSIHRGMSSRGGGSLWGGPWLPTKGSFPALRAKRTQPFPSLIYAESLSAWPATGSQERSQFGRCKHENLTAAAGGAATGSQSLLHPVCPPEALLIWGRLQRIILLPCSLDPCCLLCLFTWGKVTQGKFMSLGKGRTS